MGHISAMALFTSESWTFSEAACTFNHLKCIECLDQFLKKKKKKKLTNAFILALSITIPAA